MADLPFESDEELIVELVALPHWRAYKRFVERLEEERKQKIMAPASKFPDDFYRREQWASELRAMHTITVEVEKQAERRLKRGRD